MMNTPRLILLLLAAAGASQAGPRSSSDYSIPAETTDGGGTRTASASYTNDSSIGGVAGLSTVAEPAETAKVGYIGQLYEVAALQLAAAPATIDEGLTRQLTASQVFDDDSTLGVPAGEVAWSVLSGPLKGIDTVGLATAGKVYQDTAATAQGDHAGLTGTLSLTVLDVDPDNFGSYADDGLDDDWQVQYFGLNNPDAAPGLDPDGDQQDNTFEFTAGVVPTDPLSRFFLAIEPVSGQPEHKNLIFSPRFADRTYTVKFRPDLTPGSWDILPGGTIDDNGDERTVTDTSATEDKRFYRVEIERP